MSTSSYERQPNRLTSYDYSRIGAYFLTLCTDHRKCLFWLDPTSPVKSAQSISLSEYGCAANRGIRLLPAYYPDLTVDSYVIMPNHIHLLLQIHGRDLFETTASANISTVIQQYKGYVTKQIGTMIWQKSFYDHVVRSTDEYRLIRDYIMMNPVKWKEDRFYGKFSTSGRQ